MLPKAILKAYFYFIGLLMYFYLEAALMIFLNGRKYHIEIKAHTITKSFPDVILKKLFEDGNMSWEWLILRTCFDVFIVDDRIHIFGKK